MLGEILVELDNPCVSAVYVAPVRDCRVSYKSKLRVFCPGLFEDGDVRVGIFPEGKEILIGVFGLGHVARGNVCSAQLQVRQGAYRIGENDAAMIQDLLEFRRRLSATSCFKVRLPADIRGVEASESGKECRARQREIVRKRPFQIARPRPTVTDERVRKARAAWEDTRIAPGYPPGIVSPGLRQVFVIAEGSPESASANAAAYSTSRPFARSSASAAYPFASAAFPKCASHTASALL